MRKFYRGQSIPIAFTFYDATGGIASPSSARWTLSYPTSGFPFSGCNDSTYVTLVQNTTSLVWEGTWASLAAFPGTVFWTIRSDDASLAVQDGSFELRGNKANLITTTTT